MNYVEVLQLIRRIDCEPYELNLYEIDTNLACSNDMYIEVHFDRPHSYTGTMGTGIGRRWLLSETPTEGEVVFTCWLAIHQILEHELRESFKLDGVRLLSPHMPPEALKQLALELGV